MRERIFDSLNDGFVKLCFSPVHLQANAFAEGGRHVTYNARQFVPDYANRLHTRFHDAFLQFRGDQIQAL